MVVLPVPLAPFIPIKRLFQFILSIKKRLKSRLVFSTFFTELFNNFYMFAIFAFCSMQI
jgi:hypothetical protein